MLQFHLPRNIMLAMTGEVGELAELFQYAAACVPMCACVSVCLCVCVCVGTIVLHGLCRYCNHHRTAHHSPCGLVLQVEG